MQDIEKLVDKYGKRHRDFIECDACWLRKQAVLCNGCMHNKRVIERLKENLKAQGGHIKKQKKQHT